MMSLLLNFTLDFFFFLESQASPQPDWGTTVMNHYGML